MTGSRKYSMRILWLWICVMAMISSCSTSGSSGPSRVVSGDTTIVRSGGKGVWEHPRTFVEELTIGELDGDENLMFGSIGSMVVDSEGGIYAYDRQAPAIRYFNTDGDYVRTLGGEGNGPGEYLDAILGMSILSDGRLVTRDARNRRLSFYHADGTFDVQWPLESGLFTGDALIADNRDHLFLKIMLERPQPGSPWKIGLLHLDPSGAIVDTVRNPTILGKEDEIGGRFLPSLQWTRSRNGQMVVGFSDSYSFEIRETDGKIIIVERDSRVVDLTSGERAEWEAVNDWRQKYQGQNMTSEIPSLPGSKPPYKSLMADEDGRIWVQLYRLAEKQTGIEPREVDERTPPPLSWREPEVYDVFTSDGTYLGNVRVPEKTSIYVMRGDYAWGVRTGDSGEPYIVRLKLVDAEE